jgi:hypothetical protein
MKKNTLLPAQNNFADLREQADKLLTKTGEDPLNRLVAIVGALLYRCDLLERQVESLGYLAPVRAARPAASPKKRKR